MLALTIRTDKPESEIGLYADQNQLKYFTWQAHRQLAETIHIKLQDLLKSQSKELKDLEGIVVYQGPGSFTGLRIGISVANGIAYGLGIPIVSVGGTDWIHAGLELLISNQGCEVVAPEYGGEANVTEPKR